VSDEVLGPDALDFWLGRWSVSWRGNGRGTNEIRRALDDRIVVEQFDGRDDTSALAGMSMSIWRPEGWRQIWMDSTGGYLEFDGVEVDGRISFLTRSARPDGTGDRLQRMRWTDVTTARLVWTWEASNDEGVSWQPLWVIDYERLPD
jgi:hypothetical protein